MIPHVLQRKRSGFAVNNLGVMDGWNIGKMRRTDCSVTENHIDDMSIDRELKTT